jgi:3',5'-cyclic AMP phosphodiesterase CpdA
MLTPSERPNVPTWYSFALAVVVYLMSACGGPSERGAPPPPALPLATAPSAPVPQVPDATIVAAGDIGMCSQSEVEATARLLDRIPGSVLALGDLAYPSGSARDFAQCYDPAWGRHRTRTRPVPGNHDYETPGGRDYYAYFGENAGPAGRGYYSYREGAWLVVALNSNVAADGSSPQAAWLRAALAESEARCTLAYWHHPLFSSGPNGNHAAMRDAWRILQEAGADVVLVSHDHLYERFAPQDADGRSSASGMRQFTVGTGGAYLYQARTRLPNSEIVGSAHGVLRLTLKADAYEWQFVPTDGGSFHDAGGGGCR